MILFPQGKLVLPLYDFISQGKLVLPLYDFISQGKLVLPLYDFISPGQALIEPGPACPSTAAHSQHRLHHHSTEETGRL